MHIPKKTLICLIWLLFVMTAVSCAAQEAASETAEETRLFHITLEGGSGKAGIQSPVEVKTVDGLMTARLVWTSSNYDYMIVDGIRYDNENAGGSSTFTVPVRSLEEPLPVIGDTVAMSEPHEIEYVIHWGSEAADTETEAPGSARPGSTEPSDHANPGIRTEPDSTPEGGTENTYAGRTDEGAGEESDRMLPAAEAMERSGLRETGRLPLLYAEEFGIRFYGDYTLIQIGDSAEYLLVPEDAEVPDKLPEDTVVLRKPLDAAYLVSSSAADLIGHCGALDRIRLSGVRPGDWYNEDIRTAMEEGKILYAGRYRAPDYEVILAAGCDLAIENTMILHEPAVREKLEELSIPVLIERSSYEPHPLGRLEWIKLYGILFDREEEAGAYYDRQIDAVGPVLEGRPDTGKTVVFFHVTAGGLVNVRRAGDYITKMIELAGGEYALKNTGSGEETFSSMNMQMEDFYKEAADADLLIYNSTIGGEIGSVQELISKSPLFRDFKAVKEGNVYCAGRSLFQQTSGMADFLLDLDAVLHEKERDFVYLKKLE